MIADATTYMTVSAACPTSNFVVLSAADDTTLTSAELTLTSEGALSIDKMTQNELEIKVSWDYDGVTYISNAFTVSVQCQELVMSDSISSYNYYIPNVEASEDSILTATDYSSEPSYNGSCPHFYAIIDQATNTEVPAGWLTIDEETGLFTVDYNAPNSMDVRVRLTYAGEELLTN